MNDLNAKKYALTCPGDTIVEFMETLGWTETELSKKLGWPGAELCALIAGKAVLTHKKATELGTAFELGPDFWLVLEARYRQDLAEIARLEAIENAAEKAGSR